MTSNWGGWGEDTNGAPSNLLTDERVRDAARAVRTGTVYPLGLPIQSGGVPLVPYRGAPMRLTLLNHTEHLVLSALAHDRVYESFLVVAPLPVTGWDRQRDQPGRDRLNYLTYMSSSSYRG
jgi:hypothetical protein